MMTTTKIALALVVFAVMFQLAGFPFEQVWRMVHMLAR